jgi:hypothetical protein
MAEQQDVERVKGAQELGLVFVRSIILLNGGAFAVLLAYMAGSSSASLVQFSLDGLQWAMVSFLAGIVLILTSLIISYVYTALNFLSPVRQWLDNKVIPANAILALLSLFAFAGGVATLICNTEVP